MKVILGIGNIGERYEYTKHNIGFLILDSLAKKLKNPISNIDKHFLYCRGKIKEEEYLLVKPTTYVNKSGDAAFYILEKYNLDIKHLLVITDDINLELGRIRIRLGGGDGGHNGIASIIEALGDNRFARLRFGIGNGFTKGEMANYVLSKFTPEELEIISERIENCSNLIADFITQGINKMLDNYSKNSNKYNSPLTNTGKNK